LVIASGNGTHCFCQVCPASDVVQISAVEVEIFPCCVSENWMPMTSPVSTIAVVKGVTRVQRCRHPRCDTRRRQNHRPKLPARRPLRRGIPERDSRGHNFSILFVLTRFWLDFVRLDSVRLDQAQRIGPGGARHCHATAYQFWVQNRIDILPGIAAVERTLQHAGRADRPARQGSDHERSEVCRGPGDASCAERRSLLPVRVQDL